MKAPSRRDFFKVLAGAAGVALPSLNSPIARRPLPGSSAAHIRKAVQIDMLPERLGYRDRFRMAREAGFSAVEAQTVENLQEAQEIKAAAEEAGIRIHSVMNLAHWKYPLSASDPATVRISMDGMTTSLHNARFWGADAVLLVPAVVNRDTTYRNAWRRSQNQIRALLPLAARLQIVIAIEEVGNKFLLSPLEMAKYVDEFQSPWVRAYFDVGNVVAYGYPEDWIRTLAHRIVKLHLKDVHLVKGGCPTEVNLGDGDIDWAAVRAALADIGYNGYATTELGGGDAAYLREVSRRVDKLVIGF